MVDIAAATGTKLAAIRKGVARARKVMDFDTRADIETTSVDSPIVRLRTESFSEPGDGGGWEYIRHPTTPANHYHGPTSAFLSRPNLGYVRSLDGQWWRGVTKNTPLKVECWGAKADLWLPNLADEQFGSGSINSSPTDNLGPFLECYEFMTTAAGGYTRVGPSVQLSYGHYYFSDTLTPWFRNITMLGMGPVIYDGCTRLIFAAGKSGIHLRSSGEAPTGNRVICTLKWLDIRSLGYGGQTDKHGIDAYSNLRMSECRVDGFGGCGVQIKGGVPASESSYFHVSRCMISNNILDGIEIFGGDANIGVTEACFLYANKRWGLNEHAFLGSNHRDHHAATNGRDPNSVFTYGGPYKIDALNGPCTLFGCYSESDQQPSQINGPTTVIGGLHAAGAKLSGNSTMKVGNANYGGDFWYPKSTEQAVVFGVGVADKFAAPMDAAFSFMRGGLGVNNLHSFLYNKNDGWGFHYGNPVSERLALSLVITPEEWSWRREAWIRPNHVLLPKGFYYGGVGEGTDENQTVGVEVIRRMWVTNNPLSVDYAEHRLNDLAIATDGKSLGRLCTTAGTKTVNWTSGTTYKYGDTVVTPAGRVYWMDRIPYNPDLWVMPPPTVRATHTSGTVAYDEPNQLYDPATGYPYSTPVPGINATEHPTAGAWSWFRIDESLYPGFDFTDRTVVPHWDTDAWSTNFVFTPGDPANGTWMRNPTNGITYSCVARPVQPTKIYDQAWTQPASTIEPTHTSGSVEYREPNPSPSGSEPATIPGYVWAYLHSNIAPAYSRVGQVFGSVSLTVDVPSLASGAFSPSEYTASVPGAVMGDDVAVTCTTNSQGIEAVAKRISANGTATWRYWNPTPGTIDLASATWVVTWKRPAV